MGDLVRIYTKTSLFDTVAQPPFDKRVNLPSNISTTRNPREVITKVLEPKLLKIPTMPTQKTESLGEVGIPQFIVWNLNIVVT